MRSESEMINLILGIAQNEVRIRAVIMNGSRTNPNAPRDPFQDYDIVYVVSEFQSFVKGHGWIDIFGKRLILQMPEAMDLLPPQNNGSFNYQMLFEDGNRIDLTLIPVEKINQLFEKDSLTKILLDKDAILPKIEPSNDSDYFITPPTEKLYADCCNEFWWVLQNVAKGIWRDELPYAMRMYEYGRDMLDQMVCWYVGLTHHYQISAGKLGKYFKKYLSEQHWEMYLNTYSDGQYPNLWDSIFTMCQLFRKLALEVAEHFSYAYPVQDDQNMTAYLRHVKDLPKETHNIY